MYLRLHGGWCCGVNHIHEMVGRPSTIASEITIERLTDLNKRYGNSFIILGAIPSESGEERLKRYIKHQTGGLLEVVVTDYQARFWRECLETHGFKEVSRFNNPNTKHICIVFHRKLRPSDRKDNYAR